MNEGTKRKSFAAYFKPFPKWAIDTALIGFILSIFGFKIHISFTLAGIVLLGIGGYIVYLYLSNQKEIEDRKIDELIKEKMEILKSTAFSRVGISQDKLLMEPLLITGNNYWETGSRKIIYKRGADGIMRYNPIDVTIISFTEDEILKYTCTFDLITETPFGEKLERYEYGEEYHYTENIERHVHYKKKGVKMSGSVKTKTNITKRQKQEIPYAEVIDVVPSSEDNSPELKSTQKYLPTEKKKMLKK